MTTRKENITMRATQEEKQFLQKASEIAGFSNLTSFIMTCARKEALRLISEQSTTYLTPIDWNQVNELLNHPPEPNKELKKLVAKKEE